MSKIEYNYDTVDIWNRGYDNYCTKVYPLEKGMEIAVPKEKSNLLGVDPVMMVKIFENDSITFQSESKNKTANMHSFEMVCISEIFEPFINDCRVGFNYLLNNLPYSNSEVMVFFPEFIENCIQFRRYLEWKAHFNPINLSNSSKVILECGPLSSLFNFSRYSFFISNSSTGCQSLESQNSWSS